VVLAPASSRYQGRVMAAGALAAVVIYLVLYASNRWGIEDGLDPLWLLIEASAIGGLLAFALAKLNPLRRLLIPRWAMDAAVDLASHATFSQENVTLTKDRNAVLLYVSVLEGQVRMMPDIGVQQKVPQGKLGAIQASLANAETEDPATLVCNALRELGESCKQCWPIQEDDENELPDRPQIRLP
jgi:putative membrane protein